MNTNLTKAIDSFMVVSESRKMRTVSIREIIHLESKGIYTIIYLLNKQQIVCSRNLKKVLNDMDSGMFIRVHKSHAVNLYEIKIYEKGRGGCLVMSDGSSVPVAQRQKASFMKAFLSKGSH